MTKLTRGTVSCTLILGGLCAGCGAESDGSEEVAALHDDLLRTGRIYPTRRSIPMCANEQSRARPGYAEFVAKIEAAAYRSWARATGITMVGLDSPCPQNTRGMIVLNTRDVGVDSGAGIGYRSTGATNLGLAANVGGGTIIHELGHTLGFHHEQKREDFPEIRCKSSPTSGDTLNTPADRQSIMTGTGYCNSNQRLSYWDRIGVQHAYGFPNYFADLNGDGRAEAVLVDTTAVHALWSNGSSFTRNDFGTAITSGPWYGHKGTFFADVKGIGKDLQVAIDDGAVWVRNGATNERWINGAWWGTWDTFFADVDGDGKADIVGIDEDNIYVRKSNGSAFPAPTQNWGPSRYSRWGTFMADVAGDGGVGDRKADLIFVETDATYVSRSTGSSFEPPVAWTDSFVGERGNHVADVNGDGLADLIAVESNGVRVRLSNGSSFAGERYWISVPWYGARGTYFADVNGDRAADIIAVEEDGLVVALSNGRNAFSLPSRKWTTGPWFSE